MSDPLLNKIFSAHLSDDDFNRLSRFVFQQSGIKMPPVKKIMLQSRLQKRLKELRIGSFNEYVDYVFSPEGQKNEIIHMLDVISTNKTDFFREAVHFDFIRDTILPKLTTQNNKKSFKVWSAGCSSGEEPITIAITLRDYQSRNLNFDFSILGTDISSDILNKAALAIYNEERIANIPLEIKKKHFLKSKNKEDKKVRAIKEIRDKIKYSRLNFMDEVYSVSDSFDIIFCRNVLIYFNRETQEKVLSKLCTKLKPDGYLFIGHSESILGMDLPLIQLKPTVFKKSTI